MVLKVLWWEGKVPNMGRSLTASAGQMTMTMTRKGFRSSNGLVLTPSPLCTYVEKSYMKTYLISWAGFKFQKRKATKPVFLDISVKQNNKRTIRNAQNGGEQSMRHWSQGSEGQMGLNKVKYVSMAGLNCQVLVVGIRCHLKNKIYCLKFLSLEVPKKSLWIRSKFTTFLARMRLCTWHVYPCCFNDLN